MKNIFLTIFSILLISLSVFAQRPAPTPDDDVVKITTTLIQIDATVTDKKGNIVKDLKPEDFEIYENGKKQDITNFSFILNGSTNQPAQNPTPAKETAKSSAPLPPVKLKPEQVRRTYAIVVDDLGLSFSSITWVKNALKKFVNEQMQEGDLVAILRVGTGLGALQSFTSDKRQLLAAVEKIRWNSLANLFSYEPISPVLTDEQSLDVDAGQLAQREAKAAKDEAARKVVEIERQDRLANGALGALDHVIRGMRNLPGRKSVLLFSEGFQTVSLRGKTATASDVFGSLQSVAESATRASVVLYTFEPTGVYVPMADAQDDFIKSRLPQIQSTTDNKLNEREITIANRQNSLRYLAEETGGIANLGNNINKGIDKVFNDQSYYLLGYQPDSETFDPKKYKFNKLDVRLKRSDLKIRYRSGFYGVADDELKGNQKQQTPQQKIYAALSSPFEANEINLSLYPVFYNDFQDRNFIRALVHIDAKDLIFTLEPDGFYKTDFEIIASVFDSNGVSANNGISKTSLRFSQENYIKVQKEGVIYNLETPIIVTGGYQFRIALRDPASDKVGSASQFVEVPDLKKKNLALSQLIVRNYSLAKWNELLSGQKIDSGSDRNGFLANTSRRSFKRGTVMSYHYIIYNTKSDSRTSPRLQVQTRLFQDGKLLMENEPEPFKIGDQKDLKRIEASNAMTLGTDLATGDYILQIVVMDKNADKKNQIATQSIDFEIVP